MNFVHIESIFCALLGVISKFCIICWPAVLELRQNNNIYLYISILVYLTFVSLNKYITFVSLNKGIMGKELEFCVQPRLKVAYLRSWPR